MNINDIMNAQIDFDKVEKELEKISAVANNQKARWKPTAGQTKIRLLPYIHRLDFPITILNFHYKLGKFSWCLSNEGKPCPACDASKKIAIEGKDNPSFAKLAKELRAQERWFAPVIVRGKEDEGVKIWDFSKTVYEEILGLLKNTNGKITNVKEGCDIIITHTPAPKGGKSEYAKTKVEIDFQMFTKPQPVIPNISEIMTLLEATPKIESLFPQSTATDIEEAVKNFIDGHDEDEAAEETQESSDTISTQQPEEAPQPKKQKSQKKEPEFDINNLGDELENLLGDLN